MWTLSMFWYEVRLFASTLLILAQWYHIGWIQDFLHFFAVAELSRLARLPAEIESLEFRFIDINLCTAVAHGVQVKAPPLSQDDRWEIEQIVTVDAVRVSFPLLETLFLYVCSFGELAVVHTLHVQGLRVNVEGHRGEREGEDALVFNVSLIGKRAKHRGKKRRRSSGGGEGEGEGEREDLPIDGVEEESRDLGLSSAVLIENYCDRERDKERDRDREKDALSERLSLKRALSHTGSGSISDANAVTAANAAAPTLLHRWRALHESSGLLHATRLTLREVYHKTRDAIQGSALDQINALHTHLCGAEPRPALGEFRFAVDLLSYDRVEIHMFRALPPQIRHLERQPLVVERLEFRHLGRGGREGLLGTRPSAASRYALTHREYWRPPNGGDDVEEEENEEDNEYGSGTTAALPPLPPVPSPRPPLSSASMSSRRFSWSARSTVSSSGTAEAVSSSVATAGIAAEQCDRTTKKRRRRSGSSGGAFETFLSLDLYDGGLDFRIFQYYFERKMLYALVRYNAGRIAYDIFFSSWHSHKQHAATAAGESSTTSSSQAHAAHEVAEFHPIFFDE